MKIENKDKKRREKLVFQFQNTKLVSIIRLITFKIFTTFKNFVITT